MKENLRKINGFWPKLKVVIDIFYISIILFWTVSNFIRLSITLSITTLIL